MLHLELIPKILLHAAPLQRVQSSGILDLLEPVPKILLLNPKMSVEDWDVGLFRADSQNSATDFHGSSEQQDVGPPWAHSQNSAPASCKELGAVGYWTLWS